MNMMYTLQELIKESIEQRIEHIVADIVQSDIAIQGIRRKRQEIFKKAKEQEMLMEYEELGSEEIEVIVQSVYKVAIIDALDMIKEFVYKTL